jgi:hypothetical protein
MWSLVSIETLTETTKTGPSKHELPAKGLEESPETKSKSALRSHTEHQVCAFLRALYDVRPAKGSLHFHHQSPDGSPLVEVPSKVAGRTIYCTVTLLNELRADTWRDSDQPEGLRKETWLPNVVADLLRCYTVGETCIQCKTKGRKIHTDAEYVAWSAEMYKFWLDNILLSIFPSMKGYGLIVRNDIAADAKIGEYTGELKRVDEHLPDLETKYNCYIDIGLHGTDPATQAQACKDATDKGSIFRFMKHRCGPNTEIMKGRIGIHNRIVYFHTIRAIKKEEQLTIHYGDDRWTKGEGPCLCGITKCVKPPPQADDDKDEEVEEG